MYTIGIDMGSVGTKAVLFKDGICDQEIIPTGWSPKSAGSKVFETLIERNNIQKEDIDYIVTTGYGRKSLDFKDKAVTEITCHAKGAHYLHSETRTILDIGGQDSKVISIDEKGTVSEFLMNEKCAAGTGRFLQVMGNLLEYEMEDFSKLSKEVKPEKISSMCTVFAESEVVSLLASGASKESIALGILESIAQRASAMLSKVDLKDSIIFTGGVSKSKNLVNLLEDKLKMNVNTSENSQFAGALGAAIIGWEKVHKNK